MRFSRVPAVVGVLLVAGRAGPAAAQAGYHLDFARLSWATPADERRDRAEIDSLLERIGRIPAVPTAGDLGRLLHLADSAAMLVEIHADYWYLRGALDLRDRSGGPVEDSLYRLQDSALAMAGARIAALDSVSLARALAAGPGLEAFREFVNNLRQEGRRSPPPAGAVATIGTAWQFDLYEQLVARTDFGTVPGPSGPLDVRRDRRRIQSLPDSAVRRRAIEMLFDGYARSRDLFAFTVIQTVRGRDEAARIAGYPGAPAQTYAARGYDVASVRRAIAAVRTHGATMRRFEQAASRAREILGEAEPAPLTLDQALRAMRETYGALSPDYNAEAGALLDPRSGRLEIGGGEYRRAGGFSFALPHGLRGVYLDHFGGTPAEVSRLMHESGHALHRRLFYAAGAPYLEEAPFGEAVALFGEILLAERLSAAATDPADGLSWRLQFLTKMCEIFYGAKDAELEQTIYDSVGAGRAGTADDLDRLTLQVDSAYTADRRPFRGERWMQVQLLVEDPLYLSNYLDSGLICLELYRQYRTDARGFATRYMAFLRDARGGSPEDALARHFGVRLDDPAVQRDAFALLDSLVGQFETQVAAYPARQGAPEGGLIPFEQTFDFTARLVASGQ